jgi:AcrR family transcriptional regulator
MKETKVRILSAAARLFAERGYDGVSVRDIVAVAAVNLGAITYHFGSKEGLFGEVLKDKLSPIRRKGEEIMASSLPPDRKLHAMVAMYARHVLHEEPELRIMFSEMLLGGTRLPPAAEAGIRWRNAMFAKLVRQGIKQGIFRPCDVECAAWNFFGMLSAYILYHPFPVPRSVNGAYPLSLVERIVTSIMDLYMQGLMNRPKAGRPRV